MADLDPPSTDGAPVNSERPAASSEPGRADAAKANQTPPKAASGPEPSPQGTSSPADDRAGLDRAEELVDGIAARLSSLASSWGRKLLRLSSRARESAQDFWAEVQDFRQGRKP
jgi:hypothetical protein